MRKRNRSDLSTVHAFRIPDAAAAYSIGANVLFNAIRNGELVASKLGNAPRSPVIVTREAIERYIESRRIKPDVKSGEFPPA